MKKVRKIVVPVAGLGTRGLPATKVLAKELLPIIDTPTIHYIVEEAISSGIGEVVFVSSRGKSALEDYFDGAPALDAILKSRGKEALAKRVAETGTMAEVISVRQKAPLGLGHAVGCARSVVSENEMFAVSLGDVIFPTWEPGARKDPSLKAMVEIAEEKQVSVVGVVRINKEKSRAYGIVDLGGADLGAEAATVKMTVEKPEPKDAPSDYAIVGRYVFMPEIFDLLDQVKPGVGGEIQLTDAMNELARQGKLLAYLVEPNGYDVGNHGDYVKAQIDCALSRSDLAEAIQAHMKLRVSP